jgi:hypothetical protein
MLDLGLDVTHLVAGIAGGLAWILVRPDPNRKSSHVAYALACAAFLGAFGGVYLADWFAQVLPGIIGGEKVFKFVPPAVAGFIASPVLHAGAAWLDAKLSSREKC